jgi:outer membrane protein TolC
LLVRDQVEQVQLRVIQLYWAHALAKRFLVIAADVEKALGEAQKKVDEAVAADDPSIAVEDRYRITLFKAQLVARKSDAQKGVDMAQMGLAATLAVEPAELELADAPLVAPAPGNELAALPALVAQAASQRSDLLALDKAIVAKEAQASAAEGARFPSVFIAGTFTAAYAPGRDFQSNPWVSDPFNQLSGGVALGVRENLALPLLQAQLDQVRAELTTLRRQRQGLLRLVTVQVEGARIEAAAARERLIAAQSALGAGKSWFRAAALNFGLGVADAKALIDAYLGYVESQVGLATANYDVLVAVARLDQVTGTPLAHGDNPCVSR